MYLSADAVRRYDWTANPPGLAKPTQQDYSIRRREGSVRAQISYPDQRSHSPTIEMPMKRFVPVSIVLCLIAFSWLASACSRVEEGAAISSRSPNARMDIVDALRADLVAERSPSDGGGRVGFDGDPEPATVGVAGQWKFVFEVGPLGIEEGGRIFFQVPPFWGWSTPQVTAPDRLGYTSVTSNRPEVKLEPLTIDQGLLSIEVLDAPLLEGERIAIHYGAGTAGAMPDLYSERRSCFFFGVDGDGDGVRSLLGDRPCLDVSPGPPERLVMTLPTTCSVGETVEMVVAVLDARSNRGPVWQGTLLLDPVAGLELPSEVVITADDRATKRVAIKVLEEGVFRVVGSTADGFRAVSNPVAARPGQMTIRWADLHGHSNLTDGTGTPNDYFRYAREAAALDIVALTDHDHWGMEPLAIHPELWEEIRRETELFHEDGRFVTLLGYEWTSWIHGHRHVLYFAGDGDIYSSVSADYETPAALWEALRGQSALTFAHHSAGGPIATNWSFVPDRDLEPITEITSVHGSSEATDSPGLIYSAVKGNFVRDVLDRGYRLGFIGSGDSHDGHPGLAHLNSGSGGLAAILTEKLDRASVFEALRERRTYATNGPRILLDVELDGAPMGTTMSLESRGEATPLLRVFAAGVEPIERIDVVSGEAGVESYGCNRDLECQIERRVRRDILGGYLYVRVVQVDGGAGWSSPFFFD